MHTNKLFSLLIIFTSFGYCMSAQSEELTVKVTGIKKNKGEIACALFKTPEGFPMDLSKPQLIWMTADAGEVNCKFTELTPGDYSLSVAHDENGNKKVDTNFVGMPTEAWGVSNNIRPLMRAPRWQEAQFTVSSGENKSINIQIEK